MKRNNLLDYMKILGIIMVVINHLCSNLYGFGISMVFLSHMPVFYCVSGFLLYREVRNKEFGEFVWEKTKRLLVPYLIWSLVSTIFNIVKLVLRGCVIDEISKEMYLIFVESRSVWFLIQLFVALVIARLCYEMKLKIGCSEYFLFSAIYILILLFFPPNILSFNRFKWLFPFLCLGYVLADFIDKHKVDFEGQIKGRFLKVGWIVFPIDVYLNIRWYGWLGDVINVYDVKQLYRNISLEWIGELVKYNVIAFLGVVAVLWIAILLNLRRSFVGDQLLHMSKYTLDIYVTHKFIIYGLMSVLHPFNNRWIEIVVSIILSCFIVVCVSIISERLLRRLKLYSLSVGVWN